MIFPETINTLEDYLFYVNVIRSFVVNDEPFFIKPYYSKKRIITSYTIRLYIRGKHYCLNSKPTLEEAIAARNEFLVNLYEQNNNYNYMKVIKIFPPDKPKRKPYVTNKRYSKHTTKSTKSLPVVDKDLVKGFLEKSGIVHKDLNTLIDNNDIILFSSAEPTLIKFNDFRVWIKNGEISIHNISNR